MFKLWKDDGKPNSRDIPSRCRYIDARSNFQRISRQEKNFLHIRQHNQLMFLDAKDRSKIFATVKRFRGDNINNNDVLEGFAADEGVTHFDQSFYKLCKLDNLYIFNLYSEQDFKIPPMTFYQLTGILKSRMKAGKACDVYHLTVEHIRNCGDDALDLILKLINRILENIYYLSCLLYIYCT